MSARPYRVEWWCINAWQRVCNCANSNSAEAKCRRAARAFATKARVVRDGKVFVELSASGERQVLQ